MVDIGSGPWRVTGRTLVQDHGELQELHGDRWSVTLTAEGGSLFGWCICVLVVVVFGNVVIFE